MNSLYRALVLAVALAPGLVNADFEKEPEPIRVASVSQLHTALASAADGDVILMEPGIYETHFEIDKSIRLLGQTGVILDAMGTGSAILVLSSNVSIENLFIRNWGSDISDYNSAIEVDEHLNNIRIVNNQMSGPGYGVRIDVCNEVVVDSNIISGDPALPSLRRGDGIHLKEVNNATVTNNVINTVRDGIYIESGHVSTVHGNQIDTGRYGIHYMYAKQGRGFDNSSTNMNGGYALMGSESLEFFGNHTHANDEFGILLNLTNHSSVYNNSVSHINNPEVGAEPAKALYLYSADNNQITDNIFSHADLGVYMALGGENNRIYRNQFISNQIQVKYVGSHLVDWSFDGIGNYWSSNLNFSLSTKLALEPYRPSDALDRLFWIYPEVQFLMNSPVVSVLRWLQDKVQIYPEVGVIDSFPLQQPNQTSSLTDKKVNEYSYYKPVD
ncbi:nitrous oxide reductase family maturation protein NosD [Paraferrimonas haliotis]|uniref:Copper ABC transporter substrate-binding protein n=1 Tax=Paraferrimonas haliotis TaxID=2013866 RepID=A0AA37WXW0_9GAMM|nr:nitrous oxide reductase family maturation protein NosD [Paraferrimonas haliotis]GLS82236.1 copper ABC transporter substrate-binding protein [Paraferrimonas haliotis]